MRFKSGGKQDDHLQSRGKKCINTYNISCRHYEAFVQSQVQTLLVKHIGIVELITIYRAIYGCI